MKQKKGLREKNKLKTFKNVTEDELQQNLNLQGQYCQKQAPAVSLKKTSATFLKKATDL